MKNTIMKFGHTKVWHFTDRRNLEGIRAHGGLFPRSQLSWEYVPGGDRESLDSDTRLGMDNYVHLCFLRKHPMAFRAQERGRIKPVWLSVSSDVLDLPGVLYSAVSANQRGAEYICAEEAIGILDFDHMYGFRLTKNPL